MPAEPSLPGSAKDDFDRLKILFLRSAELDLTSPFSLTCRRAARGHGWTVSIASGKELLEVNGPCVTEIVATMARDLARKLLLRWRSDGGALQLCGIEATAFDPPEPEVVDSPPDDADPRSPRRLPSSLSS